jgi:protein SCO1/2
MSMVTVAEVFKRLTAKQKARFIAVFISVDPDRDTPELLKNFATYFDAPIIGVTGTTAEISELAERYGAQYRRVDLPGSSMGYAVDHSAALYLIDPNGALRTLYRHDAPPKKIVSDIQNLLTKKLRKR